MGPKLKGNSKKVKKIILGSGNSKCKGPEADRNRESETIRVL